MRCVFFSVLRRLTESRYSFTSGPFTPRLCSKRVGRDTVDYSPDHRRNGTESQSELDPAPCHIDSQVCTFAYLPSAPIELVCSFATLSCISSLAVAPKLPVWHLRPHEYIARKLAAHAGSDPKSMTLFAGHVGLILENEFPLSAQRKVKSAQRKERIFLGLSLLAQVSVTSSQISRDGPHATSRLCFNGHGVFSYLLHLYTPSLRAMIAHTSCYLCTPS